FLWLRQLVEWQNEIKDPRVFMNSLKIDLYPDEVYTFTPRGDVFAFPRGAMPLDFAYRIHTDVGHRCVGARVNGKLVPLRTPLKNGDIVEVLTGATQTPNREWVNMVVTSRARHKIRHWLNTEQKHRSLELGRKLTGYDDAMTDHAKCCNPLPGEPIIGYITRGKGVAIHSANCPNVKNLMFNPDREIAVEWADQRQSQFQVDLEILMEDRQGILARVVSTIANMKTNIRQMDTRSGEGRATAELVSENAHPR